MNATRIFRLATVLFFLFSVALAAPAQSDAPKADPTPLFAYDNGPLGQSAWEGVCNSNAKHFQSPINVPSSQPNPGLPAVRFAGYDVATPLTTTMTNPHNLKIYTNQRRKKQHCGQAEY